MYRIASAHRIQQIDEYYFSKKLEEIRLINQAGPEKVINLGIGSPDLMPDERVINSLQISAAKPDNHGYQSYRGTIELREAIAYHYFHTYQVILKPENMILPLMGSKEGIFHITMAMVNAGDTVLIPDPGYPTYSSVSRLCGANIQTYKVDAFAQNPIDIAAIRKLDLKNVKIMWVNFPHMPTGRTITAIQYQELINLAREYQFLIVNDNPYSLILNDTPMSILGIKGSHDVCLELNSLSKSHNMAGWRIGWLAGAVHYIDDVVKVKSNMDTGMFKPMQEAAVSALYTSDKERNKSTYIYQERQKAALSLARQLGGEVYPSQTGLFVWAKAPDHIQNVANWCDMILHKAKVFLTPGFIFGDEGLRYFRISICAPAETITAASHRIKHLLPNFGE